MFSKKCEKFANAGLKREKEQGEHVQTKSSPALF
jgi:hypothetical protein